MTPDPIAVEVRGLTEQHLIVVDGRVNTIVRVYPDRTGLIYTRDLMADEPLHELPLDPSGLIPCIRRADWQVSAK